MIRNRRNVEWQHSAQQKCAKLCRVMFISEPLFQGVACGMRSPIVPDSLRDIRAAIKATVQKL